MMEIQLPDGRVLEYPDGTSMEAITAHASEWVKNNPLALSPPPQEEDEGFLSGVGDFFTGTWQAGKRGFGTLADIPGYYGAALGSEEKFQEERAELEQESRERVGEVPPMNLAELARLYKEEGVLTVASRIPQFVSEAIAGSIPFMVAPWTAAVTAQAFVPPVGAPGLVGKAVVGAGAFIGTSALQFFGLNIGRQMEEGAETQDELKIARAALAAPSQAAAEYILFLVTGGLGSKLGKDGAEEAARTLFQSIRKGAKRGAAAEVPTEMYQQMAERWQAGLDLTSPDALMEYAEAGAAALAAGGFIGGIQQSVTDKDMRGPQKAKDTTDKPIEETTEPTTEPLLLTGPPVTPPILQLEDHSASSTRVLPPDQDAALLAQNTLDQFGVDIPLAFNRGLITTDETGTPDVYRVSPDRIPATNEAGDAVVDVDGNPIMLPQDKDGGFFVETQHGVRASPRFSTKAQAEVFKDELNIGVNDILRKQDEAETEILATEALQRAGVDERNDLLRAAAILTRPDTMIDFADMADADAVRLNQYRIQTRQRPYDIGDTVPVEELGIIGLDPQKVSDLLPEPMSDFADRLSDTGLNLAGMRQDVPVSEVAGRLQDRPSILVNEVVGRAAQKNINTTDAGFARFAERNAGHKNIERMTAKQLWYLSNAIDALPTLPGTGPQSLPTIERPMFNRSQYITAMAAARTQAARPEKNLREGEVRRSDITKALEGKRRTKVPTEAIIKSAVARGDLIEVSSTKWIHKDVANRKAWHEQYRVKPTVVPTKDGKKPTPAQIKRAVREQDIEGTTPFTRGEEVDVEAREAEATRAREAEATAERERAEGRISPLREQFIRGVHPEGRVFKRGVAVSPARRIKQPRPGILIKKRVGPTVASTMAMDESAAQYKAQLAAADIDKELSQRIEKIGGRKELLAALRKEFKKRLNKYTKANPDLAKSMDRLSVKFADTLAGNKGTMGWEGRRMIISLALDKIKPNSTIKQAAKALGETFNHEMIHVMKDAGVISDKEWSLLTKFVKKQVSPRTGGKQTWYEEAKEIYTKAGKYSNETEQRQEELFVEEAIANAFSDWAAGRGVSGKPASLFSRIADFFIALKNGLTNANIRNSNQVFIRLYGEPATPTRRVTAPVGADEQVTPEDRQRAERFQEKHVERIRQAEADLPDAARVRFSIDRSDIGEATTSTEKEELARRINKKTATKIAPGVYDYRGFTLERYGREEGADYLRWYARQPRIAGEEYNKSDDFGNEQEFDLDPGNTLDDAKGEVDAVFEDPEFYVSRFARDWAGRRFAIDRETPQVPESEADIARARILVNLSSSTDEIEGIRNLTVAANNGDESAAVLLQEITADSLRYLTSGIETLELTMTPATGLYFGDAEPSIGIEASFLEQDKDVSLSSIAKFAGNFNQQQVHVRQDTEPLAVWGTKYDDGSYNTVSVRLELATPLPRSEIEKAIKSSGLAGMTVTDQYLETYYVGDPDDINAITDFITATQKARQSLGRSVIDIRRDVQRLWAYGSGEGATNSYEQIQGEFQPPQDDQASASALRVASRLANRLFKPTQQALAITKEKRALQKRIAKAFDDMRTDALSEPDVRRAYEELADEVGQQYDAMPIKVGVWEGKGEPYGGKKMSQAMRKDVLSNNHLYIYGTDAETFGPPGVVYDNHPLLADSGRTDVNGRPLVYNDMLRAVHDYYAHTMSPVTFGPRGEEAAWRNHMLMTNSPWARWALTSETRGQNSWVNFREGVEKLPLREREFSEQKVDLLPIEFVRTGDPTVDASLSELDQEPVGEGRMGVRFSIDRKPTVTIERIFKNFSSPVSSDSVNPSYQTNKSLVYDGEASQVFIPKGHHEWNENIEKETGFGQAHITARHHDTEVVKHTDGKYQSVAELLEAAMESYWPNRNNPEAAGFVIEPSGTSYGFDAVRMEWDNPELGYPSVFVFNRIPFSAYPRMEVRRPDLVGMHGFHLITGWNGPSNGKSIDPVPMPATNIGTDRPMSDYMQKKIRLAKQRGIQDAVKAAAGKPPSVNQSLEKLSLSPAIKKRYSIDRGLDRMEPDMREAAERVMNTGGNQTFFEKIFSMFRATDPADHTFGTKFRQRIVDRFAGFIAREIQKIKRRKELGIDADIALDSATSSAANLLSRKAGITAAGITKGFLIRDRGRIYALHNDLINHSDPQVAAEYRAAYDRMVEDTAYTDPVTGEEVRIQDPSELTGLVDILAEIDKQQLWGEFFLYAAARRAQRLMAEGREKTFTDEDIEIGLRAGDTNPEIDKAYRKYQLWNNAVVNIMRDSSVISDEAAALWKANADYLPFYRELFDDAGVTYEVVSPDGVPTRDTMYRSMKDPNNRVLHSFYNTKTPRELKGGKPVYWIMVNNVSDHSRFTSKSEELFSRVEQLRARNPDAQIRIAADNQRIADPLNNMLRNLDAAITSSLQNMLVSRGIRDLRELGLASEPTKSDEPPGGNPHPSLVGVRVNGETWWYEVQDSLMLDSLMVTDDVNMPALGLQAAPATLLRELVTKDPAFMAANMLRDTFSAWTTSGVKMIPVVGTLKGYGQALLNSSSSAALEASGAVGGYEFKGDPKNAMKAFRKHMRMKSPHRYPVRSMWEYANKLSGASDTATRIAVYERVLKETGDETAAIIEALEVINFSRKGASSAIRYLTAVVPFLNARIQGLDVLYRGSTGKMTPRMDAATRRRRFYFRAAQIVALTIAYKMATGDEDENPWYHNAPEYIKDNYWIIPPTWFGMDVGPETPAYRIPIPFEVGVLFKVIPERIMRLIDGETEMTQTKESALRHLTTTFNVSFPQWFQPILEGMTNHNWYASRPIVTYWGDRNESWLADPEYVSPLSLALSEALNEKMRVRWDAEKIDHMIRGYTGTLGSYALMAADSVMRNAANIPDRADRRLDQQPPMARFLQEQQGRGPVQEFHELYNELDIFNNTLKTLSETDPSKATGYLRSRKNLAIYKDAISDIKEQLDGLRKFRRQVQSDRGMSGERKKEMLMDIDKLSNEIVSSITDRRAEILRRE